MFYLNWCGGPIGGKQDDNIYRHTAALVVSRSRNFKPVKGPVMWWADYGHGEVSQIKRNTRQCEENSNNNRK